MKNTHYFALSLYLFLQACSQSASQTNFSTQDNTTIDSPLSAEQQDLHQEIIQPKGKTLTTRFLPPKGFVRTNKADSSFANYLRTLPLKPHNSKVLLYDGSIKENYSIYAAVVDLEIGNKDLHQCADAVMRLRAEYLWNSKQYNKIHFNFTNGFRVDYNEWMKGKRIVVKGNRSYWTDRYSPSNTYEDFWKYMEIIFSYAGTMSLSKELRPVNIEEMKIGDVFIQGGFPGHAIIVADMAINPQTKEKIFLLAQSYMPAQEIQILQNHHNDKISPWYSINFEGSLETPEWNFSREDLKRFTD